MRKYIVYENILQLARRDLKSDSGKINTLNGKELDELLPFEVRQRLDDQCQSTYHKGFDDDSQA